MTKIQALVMGLAMLALTIPAATATGDSVREENREWLLEQHPDYEPDDAVTVHHDGIVEEMPAKKALELMLDRAGGHNLSALTNGAYGDSADLVGDIWVIGLEDVECGSTVKLAPQPASLSAPQAHLYSGHTGYGYEASAKVIYGFSWQLKDHVRTTNSINYGGVSDFFCAEDWMLNPHIDGYMSARDAGNPAFNVVHRCWNEAHIGGGTIVVPDTLVAAAQGCASSLPGTP